MARRKPKPDIRFEDHGSVVLVRPLTDAAREWIDENVQQEGWQWFGGALGVDARYAWALREAAAFNGLVLA